MNIFERIYRKIFKKPYTIYDASNDIKKMIRNGGGHVGDDVDIIDTIVDFGRNNSYSHLINIGNDVVITGSHLLLHDATTYRKLGFIKTGKINIGNEVFIGIKSVVLPGVTIGNKVIVGAGTIVSKDIPDNSVVVGNPMRIICTYDDYMKKQKDRHDKGLV